MLCICVGVSKYYTHYNYRSADSSALQRMGTEFFFFVGTRNDDVAIVCFISVTGHKHSLECVCVLFCIDRRRCAVAILLTGLRLWHFSCASGIRIIFFFLFLSCSLPPTLGCWCCDVCLSMSLASHRFLWCAGYVASGLATYTHILPARTNTHHTVICFHFFFVCVVWWFGWCVVASFRDIVEMWVFEWM